MISPRRIERGAGPATIRGGGDRALTIGLAAFFTVVQLYTSLAALSPTPPVGYVFASREVALVLVAVLVGGAAVAAIWLGRAAAPGSGPIPAVVLRGIGPWIGAAALASLLGVDPLSGLQVVGMMLLGAAFASAAVRFASPGRCGAIVRTYLISGIGLSLAALAMLAARVPLPLFELNHGRAAGVFVTANQFAAYLILLGPIAAGVALAARDPALRRLGACAAALALLSLGLTFSRAGWIGGAAAACVLLFAVGAKRLSAAVAVAGLGVGAYLARRPVALNHNPSESLNRIEIWRGGVRAFELFPLTGSGPMTYFRLYPAFRAPDGEPAGSFGALHPHNVVLSLAGDLGLVGLCAALYGWWTIGRAVRERVRSAADPARRLLVAGFVAAFVASLVAGMFDTIGVVQMSFVWIPFAGLALAVAERGIEG